MRDGFMNLGIAEFCLPGRTLKEKLAEAEKRRLWMELANRRRRDLSTIDSFGVRIVTVQAYCLHDLSLISKSAARRKAARKHMEETIETARSVGAKYALAVPSYGFDFISKPFEIAIEIFRGICDYALERGIVILIEALSPKRTSFLPSLEQVNYFLNAVDRENAALAADTCHVYDSGEEVVETLKKFKKKVVELHLKDGENKPPGKGSINFKGIVEVCRKSQFCLEYKSKNPKRDLKDSLKFIARL